MHPPGVSLNRPEPKKKRDNFLVQKRFASYKKMYLSKQICPSARATDNTPVKQHADGTPHRYRSRKMYGTVYTRDGVEQVSISGRQQWPERPISPWHRVPESSQLLPATAPRAARGRNNAGEAVVCIALGARGLAPSLLASPGDREDERSPAARLTHKRNNFPRAPPCPIQQQIAHEIAS